MNFATWLFIGCFLLSFVSIVALTKEGHTTSEELDERTEIEKAGKQIKDERGKRNV